MNDLTTHSQMEEIMKDGQAFLCTENVYYTTGSPEKVGKQSFTKDKLYYATTQAYLIDDNGIFKNYAWYKQFFTPAPEHDKLKVKGDKNNRKQRDSQATGMSVFAKPKVKKEEE